MYSPEQIILCLNAVVVLMTYFVVYPRLCGANGWRIAINDLLASITVLVVAGVLYAGNGQPFSLLFFSTNWFWFALLTYTAMETPLMLWYFKKHNVWDSFRG